MKTNNENEAPQAKYNPKVPTVCDPQGRPSFTLIGLF